MDSKYKKIVNKIILKGNERSTRSGDVISTFRHTFKHDMRNGFPAITTKKLAFKSCVGELLFFLSGKTDLGVLRHYSNLSADSWTIWSADAERWGGKGNTDCGDLYGFQWRNYNGSGIDQIQKLIHRIKTDPTSRYMRVQSYNPEAVEFSWQALPACHTDFTVYVDDGYLDLHWNQRSVDVALGLPFNIASYGLLLEVLAKLTGLTARKLSATLLDTHIYVEHEDGLSEQVQRKSFKSPKLILPEFNDLDELLELTAKDFKLEKYQHHDSIKFKLSVG